MFDSQLEITWLNSTFIGYSYFNNEGERIII